MTHSPRIVVRRRDFRAEMALILDEAVSARSYVVSVLAHDIVARLLASDPELLEGWLREQAHVLVRLMLLRRVAATKARPTKAGRFARAVASYQNGEPEALHNWLSSVYVADTKLTRKRLGDMTTEEVLFAADAYRARGRTNLLQEALLRAVAKKMGNRPGTVAECLGNAEIDTLWKVEESTVDEQYD